MCLPYKCWCIIKKNITFFFFIPFLVLRPILSFPVINYFFQSRTNAHTTEYCSYTFSNEYFIIIICQCQKKNKNNTRICPLSSCSCARQPQSWLHCYRLTKSEFTNNWAEGLVDTSQQYLDRTWLPIIIDKILETSCFEVTPPLAGGTPEDPWCPVWWQDGGFETSLHG